MPRQYARPRGGLRVPPSASCMVASRRTFRQGSWTFWERRRNPHRTEVRVNGAVYEARRRPKHKARYPGTQNKRWAKEILAMAPTTKNYPFRTRWPRNAAVPTTQDRQALQSPRNRAGRQVQISRQRRHRTTNRSRQGAVSSCRARRHAEILGAETLGG
jgi:hypothetical protein